MSELRRDALLRHWVIFCPERVTRPLEFHEEGIRLQEVDAFLPGHELLTPPEVYAIGDPGRAPNTPGWRVRVVPNRYPALRVEGQLEATACGHNDCLTGIGAHEVVVETPDPNKELHQQSPQGVYEVLLAYRARMLDLTRDLRMRYIVAFKNVGPLGGASLKHPHSQIMGLPVVPPVFIHELNNAREYYLRHDRNYFDDLIRQELSQDLRVVIENRDFVVLCPYASRFSFEMWVVPRRQSSDYRSVQDYELTTCAEALRQALGKLHRTIKNPSYNLVLYTAPLRAMPGQAESLWESCYRWHFKIMPRLSGIAGLELGTGVFMNPILPEEAARHLRTLRGA